MMIRAVIIKQVLWPQKQEDRTEGGWKQPTAQEDMRPVRERHEGIEVDGGVLMKVRSMRRVASNRWRERVDGTAAEDGGPVDRVWSLGRRASLRGSGVPVINVESGQTQRPQRRRASTLGEYFVRRER
jgi:hypothetical protein